MCICNTRGARTIAEAIAETLVEDFGSEVSLAAVIGRAKPADVDIAEVVRALQTATARVTWDE